MTPADRMDRVRMRPVVLSTWSVHRALFDRSLSVEEMPAAASLMACDGVEVEDIFLEGAGRKAVQRIRTETRKQRQRVVLALCNDFTVSPGPALRRQIRRAKQWLELASCLESGVVRCLAGRTRPSMDRWTQLVDALAELHEAASSRGLALAVENHDKLTRDPDRLLALVEAIGRPTFGICLDTGNFPSHIRQRAIRRVLPRTLMMHAKSWRFLANGLEPDIPYRWVGAEMRRSGFRGPVAVEFDGRGNEFLGSLQTVALVRRTIGS